jgi:hypothetical protein
LDTSGGYFKYNSPEIDVDDISTITLVVRPSKTPILSEIKDGRIKFRVDQATAQAGVYQLQIQL